MRWLGCSFAPFMGGMVAAVNLSALLGPSQTYEASWWKVGFAITASLVCSVAFRKS